MFTQKRVRHNVARAEIKNELRGKEPMEVYPGTSYAETLEMAIVDGVAVLYRGSRF